MDDGQRGESNQECGATRLIGGFANAAGMALGGHALWLNAAAASGSRGRGVGDELGRLAARHGVARQEAGRPVVRWTAAIARSPHADRPAPRTAAPGKARPDVAVRLFGAEEALREAAGATIAPSDEADYQHYLTALRGQLGAGRFAGAEG